MRFRPALFLGALAVFVPLAGCAVTAAPPQAAVATSSATVGADLATARSTAAAVTSTRTPAPASSGPSPELPSSCRPANHLGTITARPIEPGQRRYRVTLTAAPGTSPCTVQGAPTELAFTHGTTPLGTPATSSTATGNPVEFGPGQPIAFDITVPDSAGPVAADGVTFTLHAPGGVIPGESEARGALMVDAGTVAGPVHRG